MSNLKLFLLGPPRIECDGVPLELHYRKNMALLAYLAVAGERHPREALVTLLWPDDDPGRARSNLRRDLSTLRKALGGAWLVADRETVELERGTGFWLDVDRFHDCLTTCQGHGHPQTEICPRCLDDLAEAVELYRGDFLTGFSLRDSVSFDDWQSFETEALRLKLASALERLVRGHSAQGAYESAIPYARRWLALDPLHEPVHCHLMQLYAQTGQRAAALHQYQECVRVLEAELGLPPSKETTSLYEHLRAQPDGQATFLLPLPSPKHNLPAQTTSFIGREKEIAEIVALLSPLSTSEEGSGERLLTLYGPGGAGKTRLALQVAVELLDAFEHGVFFVPLAAVRDPDAVLPAIAQALNIQSQSRQSTSGVLQSQGTVQDRVHDYVRRKQLLLVLDNFEQVGAAAPHITALLTAAPDLKVLVTSRALLRVYGEREYLVPPLLALHDPVHPPDAAHLSQYAAVRLFIERAGAVRADFAVDNASAPAVAELCYCLGGSPLAIELAAAWSDMLTPEEILIELRTNLDILETDLGDVPDRQRSMRAVFEYSWRLLTPQEQTVLQALSVFRGGFTREAALAVAGATLRDLRGLLNKSLLYCAEESGRYTLHELLRQYAEEKLGQTPDGGDATRDDHSAYYCARLAQLMCDYKSPQQLKARRALAAELENASTAWEWAIAHVHGVRLDQAVEGLCNAYELHHQDDRAEATCRRAVEKLEAMVPGKDLRVLANLLTWQGTYTKPELGFQLFQKGLDILEYAELNEQDTRVERAYLLLGFGSSAYILSHDLVQAQQSYEQSLALYESLQDRWGGWITQGRLGWLFMMGLHNYKEARQWFERSLATARALGMPGAIAQTLLDLGYVANLQNRLDEAERLTREALWIFRESDDHNGVVWALSGLAWILRQQGMFEEALTLQEEALAIAQNVGDDFGALWNRASVSRVVLHIGNYDRAYEEATNVLPKARDLEFKRTITNCTWVLGCVAVARKAYAEALSLLWEGAEIIRDRWGGIDYYMALVICSLAEHEAGQHSQARQHLADVLRQSAAIDHRYLLYYSFAVAARMLADGDAKARAVELYALALQYPNIVHSRWFEDTIGHHIDAVAATLPPEVVATAQERGRARDLQATVLELLDELGE